jgi:alanyl-tRNA synthetase
MENMETVPQLNDHNKQEYPPMHTAEHILNATMVKMFGCPRSKNAHIERKKSKCDYILESEPTEAQIVELESKVNEVIASNLEVTIDFVTHQEAASIVDLSKLPDDVSETLRIVRVGDYDACACIGAHVANTSQIGQFKILSHSFNDGIWRVRWRVCER